MSKGNANVSTTNNSKSNTNTVSIANTPQAHDDFFSLNSAQSTQTFNVLANDKGGNSKSLWSIDKGASYAALITQDVIAAQEFSQNGATIWKNADGTVAYDAASLDAGFLSSLSALTSGQSIQDSFIYAIRMGNGTLSWATATVVLQGANDAPTLASGTADVDEDGSAIAIDLSLLADDVDSDDDSSSLIYTLAGVTGAGIVSISGNTLSFAAGTDYQYLSAGETANVIVQVTATDSHGSSVSNQVTITVTGSNDAPVITAGDFSADVVTESANTNTGPLQSDGTITFDDVDLSDAHSVSAQAAASGTTYGTLNVQVLNQTDINGANGQIEWSYAVDNSQVSFLAAGQTHTDRFTITLDDQQGGTVTRDVEITITGSVNAPVVTPLSTSTSEGNINGLINTILFVDDSDNRSQAWKGEWFAALNDIGYSYDTTTLGANGHPSADMDNYDLVIWSVSDRAYTNLTTQNVSALSSYLNQGGRLLYAGGHSVYEEPNIGAFASQYLGISDYTYNMPTISSVAARAASGPDGNYTLTSYAGAHYGGTMISAFNASGANATSIMSLTNWDQSRNDIAVINDNGTFVTSTWGFDLAQLAQTYQSDFLEYTLDEMGGKKFSVDLLSSATDPDGGTLTVSNLAQLGGPAIAANVDSNGVLSFTPGSLDFLDEGETLDLVYEYDVSNAAASTSTTITITVVGVADLVA